VQATTDVNAPLDRAALAQEIRGLQANMLQTINTKEGDKHIFAGYNTLKKPFSVDAAGKIYYNGIEMVNDADFITAPPGGIAEVDQIHTVDIGFSGMFVEVSFTGYELMRVGDKNTYTLMSDIINMLEDPTTTAVDLSDAKFIDKLQEQQEHFLGLIAELGGSYNRVKALQDNYRLDEEIHTERYSKIVDADYAESVTGFKTAEAMYQATLQAGARMIQPTLLDYLR